MSSVSLSRGFSLASVSVMNRPSTELRWTLIFGLLGCDFFISIPPWIECEDPTTVDKRGARRAGLLHFRCCATSRIAQLAAMSESPE